ncbi:RYR1 protein, partial [Pluvianellus socialis]|nr:RYR1 protein [Pluvianellus socialis]
MLPIGLNMCSPTDQELISLAKSRYALKDTDEEVREFLNNNLHLQGKVRWPVPTVSLLSPPCPSCPHRVPL